MLLSTLQDHYPDDYKNLMVVAGQYKLIEVGFGSNRAVYKVANRNIVFKVHYGEYAPESNQAEADLWKKLAGHPARKRIAPCRMVGKGVLVMRYVETGWPTPRWAYNVDGGQGGMYKGRWVLYDYGHELYRDCSPDFEAFQRRNKDWYGEFDMAAGHG